MSLMGRHRHGYYDEDGHWVRTKRCFMACHNCTCRPPLGQYYSKAHDKRLSQKPAHVRLVEIAAKITYKPWYHLRFDFDWQIDTRLIQMVISCRMPDSRAEGTEVPIIPIHRDHPLRPADIDAMTDDDILQMLFDEVQAIERHEAGEWFCHDGGRPFDPHLSN